MKNLKALSAGIFWACLLSMAMIFAMQPWSIFSWVSAVFLTLVAFMSVLIFGYLRAMDEWC